MKVQPVFYTQTNATRFHYNRNENRNVNYLDNSMQSVYSKGLHNLTFGANIQKLGTNFSKEIAEQSSVLQKLIDKYFLNPGTVNLDLNISKEALNNIKRIRIFASGSSKNAAEMAQDFIENTTDIPVFVESASEFMSNRRILNSKEDLAIFVSQSGSTADTLAALNIAKGRRVNTIALTNNPNSVISKKADSNVTLDAGEEKAVAATKTVTSSIFNLMAIGLKLGEIKGTLKSSDIDKLVPNFRLIPGKINDMLEDTLVVKRAAKIIANSDNLYYYAKNNNLGAVKEGALKLTETTGKRVIADSSSEALHGTFASIKPEDPMIQVITGEYGQNSYKMSVDNFKEIIKKRNVQNPIAIKIKSNNTLNEVLGKDIDPIFIDIPATKEEYTPILSTVRFQQITDEVTKILGINPDNGGGFLTKFRQNISM